MGRHTSGKWAVLILAAWGWSMLVCASEFKLKLEPTPKGLDAAEFELWIPDGLPANKPVRGVLGSSKYHAGAGVYEEKIWRDLATRKEMAILRYFVTSKGNPIDCSEAGAKAILDALKELAVKAERPELAYACIIPTGLSWGANQVCCFTKHIAERVICAVPFRGTANDIRIPAGHAVSRIVPLLHLPAGRETHNQYHANQSVEAFKTEPAQGALYANLVQPGDEHHTLGDLAFVMLWLDEVIDLRLPAEIPVNQPVALRPLDETSGWWGRFEISTKIDGKPWNGGQGMVNATIQSYAQSGGQRSKETMTWLPSERLAKAWMNFANKGEVGTVEPRKPLEKPAAKQVTRKAEPVPGAPAAAAAKTSIAPESVAVWDEQLKAKVREAFRAERTVNYRSEAFGREADAVALDEAGQLTVNAAGLKTVWPWTKLTLAERRDLAVSLAKGDDPSACALAAAYLFACGAKEKGEEQLAKVTDRQLADQVRAALRP